MATPSLAMIPSAYADSKVYSVLPNNGDGDFTFNRDSSATRVGQNGLIQTVGYFGSELILSTMINTSYNTFNEASTSGFHAINTAGTSQRAGTVDEISFVNGKKYRVNIDVSVVSGSAPFFRARQAIATSPVVFSGQLTDGNNVITFTSANTLTGVLEFSSSNAAEYRVSNVSIKEVLGDQPRLNYDISNGVVQSCPSLLLEGASTNLVTSSNNFAASGWNNFASITPIPNSLTSPEGIQNASTLACSGTDVFRYSFTSTTNTNYVGSVFVKAKETTNDFGIQTLESGTAYKSVFNIQSGVVVTQATNHTASIENFGNGWFRCIVKFNSGSTTSNIFDFAGSNSSTVKSFYGFGAQLEAGSYATSYIPTNGSSQTRAGETCNKTGLTNYIGQTEGTLFLDFKVLSENEINANIFNTNKNTTNAIAVIRTKSTKKLQVQTFFSSVNVNYVSTNSYDVGDKIKLAFKYKSGDIKLYINGLLENQSTTTFTISSSLDEINLADNVTYFARKEAVHFNSLKLFKEALTDAQLQTLTT